MSIKTYANYPQGAGEIQYVALKKLLDRAHAFQRIGIACDKFQLEEGSGASVNLRRWVNPAINTTGETEGVNPVSRALVPEDFIGTMTRYSEVFESSMYSYKLSPYNEVEGARGVLEDLIKMTRERIRYNALIAGTAVAYNSSAITTRVTVNGAISLGRLQVGVRTIEAAKGMTFTAETKGSQNIGTAPVEAGYYCFVHSDAHPDIRALPGFLSRAEMAGGSFPEGTFGAVQNIVFVTSPEFVPFLGGGAASTSFKNTAGAIDVYPFTIVAKHALAEIDLVGKGRGGFGNAEIQVLDEPDKSDPTNTRLYVTASWFDLAMLVSQEWVYRIEAAVTLNPA